MANCNRRFWVQNLGVEARNLWGLYKELRVSFVGDEDEMIQKLIAMEKRDRFG